MGQWTNSKIRRIVTDGPFLRVNMSKCTFNSKKEIPYWLIEPCRAAISLGICRRCCHIKRRYRRIESRVFHDVLRVFHDVFLVVHNVLQVFHEVLRCLTIFYDVC